MSALDVLRQIKTTRRAIRQEKVVEWGNADYINDIGIENMNRRELRNHLEARDLATNGNRLELIERLRGSLSEEQLRKFAYQETIETENLIQADIEERGSVYVCGSNFKGELGVGDMNARRFFTVIPQLRGIGVCYVVAGNDMCYAVTEEHDVYVWGGGGYGRTGLNPKSMRAKKELQRSDAVNNWLEPQLLTDLTGEECFEVVIGMSHSLAVGCGGDCLVWGDNDSGQLGLGDFTAHPLVAINNSFPAIMQVACGANHSMALTRTGQVYTWGHASNGRLGVGASERLGVIETERLYFPVPQTIKTLEPIKQISCGADHALAYGASGVWSWGSGAGGKLGMGDTKDRYDPCLIPRLRGKSVMQVAAGTWHSMCLIAYPPMAPGGGWIHTWGSGYHGQLAQSQRQVSLSPEIVEYFVSFQIVIKFIAAGPYHSAAITLDGELYTWGSNTNGCLGRKIDEKDVVYTPVPGFVSGFSTIVGRTGRGLFHFPTFY